jgi:hypothetical protein
MTHAEGPLPDDTSGQIFSGLHGATTRVPGGLLALPLGLRPESAGSTDFLTPGGIIEEFGCSGPYGRFRSALSGQCRRLH